MPQKKSALRVLSYVLMAVAVVCALAATTFEVYCASYYRATEQALAALQSDSAVYVAHPADDVYLFEPQNPARCDTGVVLYPGGKVQAESYAPLCRAIAERGVTCSLVVMPHNLAIFDVDAADKAMGRAVEVRHWYLAGHSLGGAAAALCASKHAGAFDGLVLLASYSTADLSTSGLRVLCVYGANDGVLDFAAYDEARNNLPSSAVELAIRGGNHAQFGSYGSQDGDGQATITSEEQVEQTTDAIATLISAPEHVKETAFSE